MVTHLQEFSRPLCAEMKSLVAILATPLAVWIMPKNRSVDAVEDLRQKSAQ